MRSDQDLWANTGWDPAGDAHPSAGVRRRGVAAGIVGLVAGLTVLGGSVMPWTRAGSERLTGLQSGARGLVMLVLGVWVLVGGLLSVNAVSRWRMLLWLPFAAATFALSIWSLVRPPVFILQWGQRFSGHLTGPGLQLVAMASLLASVIGFVLFALDVTDLEDPDLSA